MFPNDEFSNPAIPQDVIYPKNFFRGQEYPKDVGPITLGDDSQGLIYQLWELRWDNGTGDFIVYSEDGQEISVTSSVDVVPWRYDVTFDTAGRVFICWGGSDGVHIYWFDPLLPGFTDTLIVPGGKNPFCHLDYRTVENFVDADIVLTYELNNAVYYRRTSQRYTQEFPTPLTSLNGEKLVKCGVGVGRRFAMVTAAGNPAVSKSSGSDPMVMLDVSGNTRTWDMTQNWRSMGKKGEYNKRVIWRRLGQHRSFTPRIAISAPVKRAVIAAYAEIEPSNS